MATTANITPIAETDGVVYGTSVPVVGTEGSLGGGVTPDPIPVVEGQTLVAVVKLAISGIITAQMTYVVLQTDLGDGTWVDVAWIVWTANQGTATFVLCGGGLGQMNNAFQQSRNAGSVPNPQAAGSNAVPLGGRCRFVGKATQAGGSSAVAGLVSQVTATITYRLQTPR